MTSEQRRVLRDCWRGMIRRCHDESDPGYKNYGARGIAVCQRWRESFAAFAADMGPRPDGALPSGRALYSIERREVNGDYTPGNCYWATLSEQAANRRDNRRVSFRGRTMIVAEWARELGITSEALLARLKTMPVARALTRGRIPNAKGAAHVQSKLSSAQVRAIRSAAGTNISIAKAYGISNQLVSRIRLGQHRGDE